MITGIDTVTQFGSSALIAGKISHKFRSAKPASAVHIKKPAVQQQKESAAEAFKQMFFELFPKFDPDYEKVFGHINKKV